MLFVNVSDKPSTPTLSVSPANPTDGEDVELTCRVTNSQSITKYLFLKHNRSWQNTAGNKYTISKAPVNQTDNYACQAYIDTVSSDNSSDVDVKGRIVSMSCITTFKLKYFTM